MPLFYIPGSEWMNNHQKKMIIGLVSTLKFSCYQLNSCMHFLLHFYRTVECVCNEEIVNHAPTTQISCPFLPSPQKTWMKVPSETQIESLAILKIEMQDLRVSWVSRSSAFKCRVGRGGWIAYVILVWGKLSCVGIPRLRWRWRLYIKRLCGRASEPFFSATWRVEGGAMCTASLPPWTIWCHVERAGLERSRVGAVTYCLFLIR